MARQPEKEREPERTRDPERTRSRILAAALREFAAKGFAGARVDAIARRARVNKRMLYHYFGDKRGLFKASVAQKLAGKRQLFSRAPEELSECLVYYHDVTGRDSEWTRMLLWEALAHGDRALAAEEERREVMKQGCARVRRSQENGLVSKDLDPEYTLLALVALSMFPWAFPQMARLITADAPGEAAFRARYGRVLHAIGSRLAPAPSESLPSRTELAGYADRYADKPGRCPGDAAGVPVVRRSKR